MRSAWTGPSAPPPPPSPPAGRRRCLPPGTPPRPPDTPDTSPGSPPRPDCRCPGSPSPAGSAGRLPSSCSIHVLGQLEGGAGFKRQHHHPAPPSFCQQLLHPPLRVLQRIEPPDRRSSAVSCPCSCPGRSSSKRPPAAPAPYREFPEDILPFSPVHPSLLRLLWREAGIPSSCAM